MSHALNRRRLRPVPLLLALFLVLTAVFALPRAASATPTLSQHLVVTTQQDGRLMVFARRTDNMVVYAEQNVTNGTNGWSDWRSLGKQALGIAVAHSGTYLMVFIRGLDNHTYWARQTVASSDSWSGWSDLGGATLNDPTVVVNGGLMVFVRGTDNALYGRYTSNTGGTWSPSGTDWAYFGTPNSVGLIGQPVAAADTYTDGSSPVRTYIFGKEGASGILDSYTIGQAGWYVGSWGSQNSQQVSDQQTGFAHNKSGTLEIFNVGPDGAVWHQWTSKANSGTWSSFASLGLPGGLVTASAVAAGRLADGSLDIVVVRDDGSLAHRRQTAPGTGWAAWQVLGGQGRSHPAMGQNVNGTAVAFVVGTDHRVYQNPTNSSGTYAGWGSINATANIL
jgi:hypothetical protein